MPKCGMALGGSRGRLAGSLAIIVFSTSRIAVCYITTNLCVWKLLKHASNAADRVHVDTDIIARRGVVERSAKRWHQGVIHMFESDEHRHRYNYWIASQAQIRKRISLVVLEPALETPGANSSHGLGLLCRTYGAQSHDHAEPQKSQKPIYLPRV